MTRTSSSLHGGQIANLPAIRAALLEWFAASARDLPWRRTRDPYRIMVSEIMLQQTQVDRVLPKYHAFIETFPTLEALAAASTAEIIRAWAGLGYNRRAVNMQRAARAVLDEHGGQFPRDMEALLKLPAIAPYTGGAIACCAFEQDVAFMDTNIRRVAQRLFAGPEDDTPTGEQKLLASAAAAGAPGQAWAWNQAMIELGALICTAAAPACWRCPVRAQCQAYAAWRSADEQIFGDAPAPEPSRRRRLAERREAPYAGSNRFFRGRAVEALRRLPHDQALPLRELGLRIKAGFGDDDMPWLRSLVAGLARDVLLAIDGDTVRLPP